MHGTRFLCPILHARTYWGAVILISVMLASVVKPTHGDEPMEKWERPASWREDACLRDVFFIDEMCGWAVGDQGLILRTIDGGHHWTRCQIRTNHQDGRSFGERLDRLKPVTQSLLPAPVQCRLTSVHFVDRLHGWVAGSFALPYVDRTRAVVLQTEDGGRSWQRIRGLVLPGIQRIRFDDRTNGWAVGDSANLYRTGLQFTTTGGQTWSAQGAAVAHHWTDADWTDPHSIVCVDDQGELGTVRDNAYEPAVTMTARPPRIRAVRMLDARRGCAVGDRGTVLMTRDGGASWKPIDENATGAMESIDLTSIAIVGERGWIVGVPGTHLFSVDFQTGQVTAHRMPSEVPLERVYFVNDQKGWAVGSLGTILATQDSGASWQIQRRSSGRLAMLVVARQPGDIPLELLARYGGEENFLCGVICLNPDPHDRWTYALPRIGCSWSHSADPSNNRAPDGTLRLDQATWIRWLRTVRPDAIVAAGGTEQYALVAQLRQIIEAAANPRTESDALSATGLPPWQVSRLVYPGLNDTSSIQVESRKILVGLGQLLGDFVALSRAQLGQPITAAQPVRRYAFESLGLGQGASGDALFDGLSKSPRRESRHPVGSLATIRRATNKQKWMNQMGGWEVRSPTDQLMWQQQIQSFALGVDPDTLGIWLVELADHYFQRGQTELGAATLEAVLRRVDGHPLEPALLLALSRYYASEEFYRIDVQRNRLLSGTESDRTDAAQSIPRTIRADGATTIAWLPVGSVTGSDVGDRAGASSAESTPPGENGVTKAGATDSIGIAAESLQRDQEAFRKSRLERASQFLARLGRIDPDLVRSAQARWLEAELLRQLRGAPTARSLFRNIARDGGAAPLAVAARRESRLAEQAGPTDTAAACFRAEQRPLLDGRLDDDLWQQALEKGYQRFLTVAPRSAQESARTDVIWLAWDDEFLFVAARCQKIRGQAYQVDPQPRRRDADLRGRDRLRLTLDLDRDATTQFQFTIDHRGWGCDSVCGLQAWNPKWYIAAGQDERAWMVEAAIPWAELRVQPVMAEMILAARLERIGYDGQPLWQTAPGPVDARDLPDRWTSWIDAHPERYEWVLLK